MLETKVKSRIVETHSEGRDVDPRGPTFDVVVYIHSVCRPRKEKSGTYYPKQFVLGLFLQL